MQLKMLHKGTYYRQCEGVMGGKEAQKQRKYHSWKIAWKQVPVSGKLVAESLPPKRSVISLVMASPSPWLPLFAWRLLSAR